MDPYWLIEIFSNIGSHRHKSICASLQVSLAQIDLNRWRAYLPTGGTSGTVRLWLAYSPEAALH